MNFQEQLRRSGQGMPVEEGNFRPVDPHDVDAEFDEPEDLGSQLTIIIPDNLTKSAMARGVTRIYDLYEELPDKIVQVGGEPGLNPETAFAIALVLEEENRGNWEPGTVLHALFATQFQLAVAGTNSSAAIIEALKNGMTGEDADQIIKAVPESFLKNLSRGAVGAGKAMVQLQIAQAIVNELLDERKLIQRERTLRGLLSTPGGAESLALVLNDPSLLTYGKMPDKNSLSSLPIENLSPFSLPDLKAIEKRFKTIEDQRNLPIITAANAANIEMEAERIFKAGVNTGVLAGGITRAAVAVPASFVVTLVTGRSPRAASSDIKAGTKMIFDGARQIGEDAGGWASEKATAASEWITEKFDSIKGRFTR